MRHNNNYLSLVILAATLLFSSGTSAAELPDNPRDAYLAGAMTIWLEQSLGWTSGSYELSVHDGLVTVTLPESDLQRRAVLEDAVPPMQGIEGINIVYGEAGEPLSEREQRVYSFLGLAPNTIPFPTGDIFWPLLADPKQPEFFVSWRRYKIEQEYFTTAAVGYGFAIAHRGGGLWRNLRSLPPGAEATRRARNVDNFLKAFDAFENTRSTEKCILSINMNIMLSFISQNSSNSYYINMPNRIGFLMQIIL